MADNEWIKKLDWQEMRDSGLLWFINNTLHLFGRAIVFDYDKDEKGNLIKLKEVYWARCKFRGFSSKNIEENFIKVTKFLKENIEELEKDCKM